MWERLKNISSLITAALAITSVIISTAVFVIGYFATREQLKTVDCVYRNWTDALSSQIEQVVLLNVYNTQKAEWTRKRSLLDRDRMNNSLRIEVDEAKRDMDDKAREILAAQHAAKKSLAAKEECLRKGPLPQ